MKIFKKKKINGFTLVELLVVMVIIGILAVVSLANFQTSQKKARDAERKANLRQISNAMEAYMSDHASYPSAQAAGGGQIKACGCKDALSADLCDWTTPGAREFCDQNNTVYMKEVGTDPVNETPFCYKSAGSSFQLYAKLENGNDPDWKGPYTCGGINDYNFGVSSGNTTP